MSIENIENNIKEEENKEDIDPCFLRNQFLFSNKDEWDEKFCELIRNKLEEKQKLCQENQESTDKSFVHSLYSSGLKKDDLKDKRILDLGSGDGAFVQELMKNNITKEAFGLDLDINNDSIKQEFKDHFFQGDFQKELPVKDVDYIVSNGAINRPGSSPEEESMDVEKIIENSINSLKDDGEIRIGPIFEAREDSDFEGYKEDRKVWEDFLSGISEKYNLEFSVEPIGIFVFGGNNDIAFQSVLIIKKKRY